MLIKSFNPEGADASLQESQAEVEDQAQANDEIVEIAIPPAYLSPFYHEP